MSDTTRAPEQPDRHDKQFRRHYDDTRPELSMSPLFAPEPGGAAPRERALETLAQVRKMCADMVVASDIGKRAHAFALKVWTHLEHQHPELKPADWGKLADIGGGSLPNTTNKAAQRADEPASLQLPTPDLAPLEALAEEWEQEAAALDMMGKSSWRDGDRVRECIDELRAVLAQMKGQS